LRFFILVLLTFTALSHRAYALTDEEIVCHRHLDPKTELTRAEHNYLLGRAIRVYHARTGKWGKFVGFRQAIIVGDELHAVATFDLDGSVFEIVIVYDTKLERAVYAVVPNAERNGVEEYEIR
jgi:hypothetical protein